MFAGAILAASLALTAAQSQQIDAVVAQVMQADHVPGLSLGIAQNGRVLLARGYGVRNAAGAHADAQTIYRIGSLTKQFTAALVEIEADRGVLPLNVEIRGVSVAQMLSQTSGLVSYTDPGQTLDSALNAPTKFAPGTQWDYSNSNYYLLGTALQSATNQPYAQLLQRTILRPLKLTATTFNLPFGNDVAVGSIHPGPNAAPMTAFAAGALSSNVVDLLRWLNALQNGDVVPSDSFEQMTSSWALNDGTLTHYGFGFYVDNWYGWPIAQHNGLIDGFSSDDAISLDDGVDIVVLTNADKEPLAPLVKSIFALVDKPKDANLVASLNQPPENEDTSTTALATKIATQIAAGTLDKSLLTTAYAGSLDEAVVSDWTAHLHPMGAIHLAEFLELTHLDDADYVKYRLTFDSGQVVMTLGLRGGKVNSIAFETPR